MVGLEQESFEMFAEDDPRSYGIDMSAEREPVDQESLNQWLSQNGIDMQDYSGSQEKRENTALNVIQDIIVQGSRGLAQVYTYPADLLKLAAIGEGIQGIDEVEEAYRKAGKPFDRNAYLKNVAEASEIIPTQDLIEKGIEKLGVDLSPKSDFGEAIRKFFFIGKLSKGGALARGAAGAVAAGTTAGLEAAGTPELYAEFLGDVAGLSPQLISKGARALSKNAEELANISEKHGLPFWEGIARDVPQKNAIISGNTTKRLRNELNLSVDEAIDSIVSGRLSSKRLRDQGYNLDSLIEEAYSKSRELASQLDRPISLDNAVKSIKGRSQSIIDKAPMPSLANEKALSTLQRSERAFTGKLAEDEISALEKKISEAKIFDQNGKPSISLNGEILEVQEAKNLVDSLRNQPARPISISADQAINQIQEINQDLATIYKNPEFTGKENAVRTALEEVKAGIRSDIEREFPELRNQLDAADKLYSESKKLWQTEAIVEKYMKDGSLQGKRFANAMGGKEGKFIARNLGEEALSDLKDIGRFAEAAENNVLKLGKAGLNPSTEVLLKPLTLLPFVFGGHGASKVAYIGNAMKPYVIGNILARPATRHSYQLALREAAKGNMKAFASHLTDVENHLTKEFGSVNEFIKEGVNGLEIWSPNPDTSSQKK